MIKRNTQAGFGIVGIVLVIVVLGVIGGLGWVAYKNFVQKPVVESSTATQKTTSDSNASATPTIKTTTSTLKIPEMGIKLVNIPSSLDGLAYSSVVEASNGDMSAEFSTITLCKLYPSCTQTNVSGPVSLAKTSGTYSSNPYTSFVKQFDGFWIGYQPGPDYCNAVGDKNTQSLCVAELKTLVDFFKNPDNIQTL